MSTSPRRDRPSASRYSRAIRQRVQRASQHLSSRGRVVCRGELLRTMTDASPGADEDHGDLRDLGELHGVVHRAGGHRYRVYPSLLRRGGYDRDHLGIARHGWPVAVDAKGDRQVAPSRYLIDQRLMPGQEQITLCRVWRSRVDREGDLTWDHSSLIRGNDDPADGRYAGASHAMRRVDHAADDLGG